MYLLEPAGTGGETGGLNLGWRRVSSEPWSESISDEKNAVPSERNPGQTGGETGGLDLGRRRVSEFRAVVGIHI